MWFSFDLSFLNLLASQDMISEIGVDMLTSLPPILTLYYTTRTSTLLDGFWTVGSDLYLSNGACIIERLSTLTLKYGWVYGVRVPDWRRVHTHAHTLTLLVLVHASNQLDDFQSALYSPRIIRVCCTHQRSRLIQSP
jgi:hypothetical protein